MSPLERIEQVLIEKNISKPTFQKKLGILSQHWNNWKLRGIPSDRIFFIASELNISADWIASGKGDKYANKQRDSDTHSEPAQASSICINIPVTGIVQFSDNGQWNLMEYPEGRIDSVIKYPGLTRNAYALRCAGGCHKAPYTEWRICHH